MNLLRRPVGKLAGTDVPAAWSQRSFSQEGEDLAIGRLFGAVSKGFYVDVGSHHHDYVEHPLGTQPQEISDELAGSALRRAGGAGLEAASLRSCRLPIATRRTVGRAYAISETPAILARGYRGRAARRSGGA